MARELRLVLTQKCPQNCIYCHKEGMGGKEKALLAANDYVFIFKTARKYLGIERITITGGEPLVRKDIKKILKALKIEGAKIKLVTNGILLKDKLEIISYIENISISFTSLVPSIHQKIHKSRELPSILQTVKKLSKLKTKIRIRVNVCLVKGVHDDVNLIKDMVEFAEKYGLVLRFVELLGAKKDTFLPIEKIANILKKLNLKLVGKSKKRWFYETNKGIIVELQRCLCRNVELSGDIDFFCKQENDIFISPDGEIKPCMMKQGGRIDIYEAVKQRDSRLLGLILVQAVEQFGISCPQLKTNNTKKEKK